MPSVVHLVTTRSFAGVERYVADVANETAGRGWSTTVVGGDESAMRRTLDASVAWAPGGRPVEALRSLVRAGRQDVCHAHMTAAEAVAVLGRRAHRAPIVVTRHFAAPRGASRLGAVAAPWIARAVTREVAVSEYVAGAIGRWRGSVVPSGVRPGPLLWRPESRTVLVLQRLEAEKDTATALRAWERSGLAGEGWSLRVAGDGAERASLERWVAERGVAGVAFVGWAPDPAAELAAAGILLAPGPRDSFGLTVVEAMAAGVPVVAAAAGGHLETIGLVPGAPSFPPGDDEAAAAALRSLLDVEARASLSAVEWTVARERLTVAAHVDGVLAEYDRARAQ